MKSLSVRHLRGELTRLEEILAKEGEILVTRRNQAIARMLPIRRNRSIPSHADLRASMRRLRTPSQVLVRRDRESR